MTVYLLEKYTIEKKEILKIKNENNIMTYYFSDGTIAIEQGDRSLKKVFYVDELEQLKEKIIEDKEELLWTLEKIMEERNETNR